MFFTAFVLCILKLLKLKTEGQAIYRNPHWKVTKLKSKLRLSWASLVGFEQQGPGAPLF